MHPHQRLAREQELTAYFALGFFAGFRPHEVVRLEWRHVDFVEGHIELSAKDTKTKIKHRFLPLHDNLRAWLTPVRKEQGKIANWSAPTIARRRKKIAAGVGLEDWPKDVARHSDASHRKPFIPKHKLAAELGNQEEVNRIAVSTSTTPKMVTCAGGTKPVSRLVIGFWEACL